MKRVVISLTVVTMLWLVVEAATACFSPLPDHDWTVRVGEHPIGIIAFGERSWVCLGPVQFPLPFSAPVAAAVVVGLPVLVMASAWRASRRAGSPAD